MLGTLNILEFARHNKIKSIVFASSSSVYGNSKDVPFKETQKLDNPISLYAATKKANELYAYTYHHLFNINMIGLRFFTVYGPWGRPDMALFKFTNNILNNKPIEVFNNGNLKRDFTYVDDIVNGILKSIDKLIEINNKTNISNVNDKNKSKQVSNKSSKNNLSNQSLISTPKTSLDSTNTNNEVKFFEIINLGRGEPIKLMDFIKEIETATKKKAKLKMTPMQAGDVNQTFADISKAKALLGYEPKTSIREGVRSFVEWYKEYYGVK
jgi:UDP-glucuronate 4-epimerase